MRREHEIFDNDGNSLGKIPLSENQMKTLAMGCLIAVRYHTPQMLREILGDRSGLFELRLADGNIVTQGTEETKRYIAMLDDIDKANA